MIIILEGPDGSGKTFLANQLCTRFSLRYHHEGVPPANIHPLEHYGTVLARIHEEGKGCVIDRFALGERIYGPAHRGKDRLGDNGWRKMQKWMKKVKALQVLCLPPFDVCHATWASGREELIKEYDTFVGIYVQYGYYANEQDVIYDYTRIGEFIRLCRWLEDRR